MLNNNRVYTHKITPANGNVIYRMSRDQRVSDNWALLFAQSIAESNNVSLAVVFTLNTQYPFANSRNLQFMVNGLMEVEQNLSNKGIPFILLLTSNPTETLKSFINSYNVTTVVSDFDPIRVKQQWIKEINDIPNISHFEVDAHNVVPCRLASSKQEFGAYTIRPKINRLLPDYLTGFPTLNDQQLAGIFTGLKTCWEDILNFISSTKQVVPSTPFTAGERAAKQMLDKFLREGIDHYAGLRNNPTERGQSNLSPYLHFGQISAQRVAYEVSRRSSNSESKADFLEELIVRRELADNFCFYNSNYDNPNGFPDWAKKNMEEHQYDKRDFLYSLNQLEQASTHDPLWNAAQAQMLTTGKMHGYMRMYWAKKILEWTPTVEEAMKVAIYLNDTYSIDGRDPNGYAGIAWSIGGVHDRAWFPREVFGKIRYMSYNGCKSKFDVQKYIQEYALQVETTTNRKSEQ